MPMGTRRAFSRLAVATALLGSLAFALPAQAYPDKPVTIIVAWAAGGATDVVTRALEPVLAEKLGANLVIRNITGAAGTIGTAEAAAAEPDGHTILITPAGPITTQPHLRELPYDLPSFDAVGRINITPMLMMVTKESPYQTLDDIISASREKPGSVKFASTGAGTLPHISILALNQAAGIDTKHVPFQGSANVMQALMGGVVDVFSDQAQLVPQYELHPVVAWADERLPEYPDVPTVKEGGYDLAFANWLGMFVPAGTPEEIRAQLGDALEATLETPSIVEALEKMKLTISHMNGEDLTKFAQAEHERNGRLLADAGLKK